MSKRLATESEKQLWQALNRGEFAASINTDVSPLRPTDKSLHFSTNLQNETFLQEAFLPRPALRRFSKTTFPIHHILDLHGMTVLAAQTNLIQFIQRYGQLKAVEKPRRLLVITGKGKHGTGILRQQLPSWLTLPAIAPYVSSYKTASLNHGGSGAFYIFLKS